MTITPLDFAAIIGLSFSREPIHVSNEAYNSAMVRYIWLKDLFRAIATVKSGCVSLVRYTQLVDKVRLADDAGHISSEQLARCFLFYLFSAIIFPNASGTGYLQLLPVLKNLRDMLRYSWGTTALCHMYSGLDMA